jgi:hypothetical protein
MHQRHSFGGEQENDTQLTRNSFYEAGGRPATARNSHEFRCVPRRMRGRFLTGFQTAIIWVCGGLKTFLAHRRNGMNSVLR